jgi:hypothetical protein
LALWRGRRCGEGGEEMWRVEREEIRAREPRAKERQEECSVERVRTKSQSQRKTRAERDKECRELETRSIELETKPES